MAEEETRLSGITTKLVEVIDVPVVDESGNITKDYKEYEYPYYLKNGSIKKNKINPLTNE